MSYLRTISISTLIFIQTTGTHAADVEQDFQRCAATALQERGQTASMISVRNGGLRAHDLNHDASRRATQYRMQITNNVSGKDLGIVTCKLSRSGDILAARFDS